MWPDDPLPAIEQTTSRTRGPARTSTLEGPRFHPSPSAEQSSEPQSCNVPVDAHNQDVLNQSSTGPARSFNEMHRSSSPPDSTSGTIKYTRTGRVSKATKGQRVHHCDECGKTYTRAEHLRRHQQNHKPGAFPCDVSGCNRSFYREDLLARHKLRHNDPLNPPSRRASLVSQSPAPDTGSSRENDHAIGLLPSLAVGKSVGVPPLNIPDGRPRPIMNSRPQKQLPVLPAQPSHRFAVGVDPYSIDIATPPYDWDPIASRPASPRRLYDSPIYGAPYFQTAHPTHEDTAELSTFPSFDHPHPSQSPVSAGSSTAVFPQWSTYRTRTELFSASQAPYFPGEYSMVDHDQYAASDAPYPVNRSVRTDLSDSVEQANLTTSDSSQWIPSLDPAVNPTAVNPDQQRFMAAFWHSVHPLYSIIRRPTFNPYTTPDLLRNAIFALGARATGSKLDLNTARDLHEKCLKEFEKRFMNGTYSYRLCDMQAVVLTEIYSIFKARRPPLHFSKQFEIVYRTLSYDPAVAMQTPLDHQPNRTFPAYLEGYPIEDLISKQRLLVACYILDQQHAALFGRQPSHQSNLDGLDLPFPGSQDQWDGFEEQSKFDFPVGTEVNHRARVSEAFRPDPYALAPHREQHDIFRAMLLLAAMRDPRNDREAYACSDDEQFASTLVLSYDDTSCTRLAFHTMMLTKCTPVRALLAVAGESWVMGEKLRTEADYTAAQIEIREWAAGFNMAGQQNLLGRALTHAFEVLRIVQSCRTTTLLFQEWSVFLACIVVWAGFYVRSEDIRQPASAPMVSSPTHSPSLRELEETVATLLLADPPSVFKWKETRNLLLWAKSDVKRVDVPHTCGLSSGALDILGKLAVRGNEGGWF